MGVKRAGFRRKRTLVILDYTMGESALLRLRVKNAGFCREMTRLILNHSIGKSPIAQLGVTNRIGRSQTLTGGASVFSATSAVWAVCPVRRLDGRTRRASSFCPAKESRELTIVAVMEKTLS